MEGPRFVTPSVQVAVDPFFDPVFTIRRSAIGLAWYVAVYVAVALATMLCVAAPPSDQETKS
jgi:hypothetical protein